MCVVCWLSPVSLLLEMRPNTATVHRTRSNFRGALVSTRRTRGRRFRSKAQGTPTGTHCGMSVWQCELLAWLSFGAHRHEAPTQRTTLVRAPRNGKKAELSDDIRIKWWTRRDDHTLGFRRMQTTRLLRQGYLEFTDSREDVPWITRSGYQK